MGMLLQMGKFGIYVAGIIFVGGYILGGGAGPEIKINTPSNDTIKPLPNTLIPGINGRDYIVGGLPDTQGGITPVPGTQDPAIEPGRLDPVLSNGQVSTLKICVEGNKHRMKRVNGEEAFAIAASEGTRLLVKDGYNLMPDPLAFMCEDYANGVHNQIGSLEAGKCRSIGFQFSNMANKPKITMQFCRVPETGKLVLGPEAVKLSYVR